MNTTNESSLKEVIVELLHQYKLQDGITRAKLIASWEKIAGRYISSQTESIFIKNKKLYLKLKSAALKHELSFARSKLMKSLNASVGHDVIEEVVFL